MNEFFVAEPNCCESIGDLRFLLSRFGTHAGRYLVEYPKDWRSLLREKFQSPMEEKRFEYLLEEVKKLDNAAILVKPSLPWKPEFSWVDNALNLTRIQPPELDEIITSPLATKPGTVSFDDPKLFSNAGERIHTQPNEYVRVCKTLMIVSHELHFIDPYLNPCKKDYQVVLEEMLKVIAKGKCRRVIFWAKTSYVIGERRHSWEEVVRGWKDLLRSVGWPDDRCFQYNLVDDSWSDEIHARYLLSFKGAVRLDKGFQRQPRDRKVDVSPVDKSTHDDLWQIYHEGKHDMKIEHCFQHNQRLCRSP